MTTPPLTCFVVTAPGFAPLAALELAALGIRGVSEPAGITFNGTALDIYRANLHLRTASRVLVRVAHFGAREFFELEKQAKRLPWERYITPGQPLRLRVTCRKSRLYHSDAVAERVARAIGQRLGQPSAYHTGGEADDAPDDETTDTTHEAMLIVRFVHDECTISLDTSGAHLHRRGYRLATAKAPLRETLAAALVLGGGRTPEEEAATHTPILDPFCGAGTLIIEAALSARRHAPGLARSFAFMHAPDFDAALWAQCVADAQAARLPHAPGPLFASDLDAGAITAAQANAARAGVADDITFEQRALADIAPPAGPGWLIANPPYGLRIGADKNLNGLYMQIGEIARKRCRGWRLTLYSASDALIRQTGLPLKKLLSTTNGGVTVALWSARV